MTPYCERFVPSKTCVIPINSKSNGLIRFSVKTISAEERKLPTAQHVVRFGLALSISPQPVHIVKIESPFRPIRLFDVADRLWEPFWVSQQTPWIWRMTAKKSRTESTRIEQKQNVRDIHHLRAATRYNPHGISASNSVEDVSHPNEIERELPLSASIRCALTKAGGDCTNEFERLAFHR